MGASSLAASWDNGNARHLVAALPASFATPMARHLRREFSTFDWIMRQILDRAGFAIEHADVGNGFMSHYLCRRT